MSRNSLLEAGAKSEGEVTATDSGIAKYFCKSLHVCKKSHTRKLGKVSVLYALNNDIKAITKTATVKNFLF